MFKTKGALKVAKYVLKRKLIRFRNKKVMTMVRALLLSDGSRSNGRLRPKWKVRIAKYLLFSQEACE